jgi:hypothetical protein
MDQIIKNNPKNEFVKAMQTGRDHHHFNVNIPRKDYSQEFKNGFFNGRTLAEHDPKMIDNLLSGKGLHKDYKKGIEAAKKEHEILSIQERLKKEPKTPDKELRNDENYTKGFNVGYRLGGDRPFLSDYLKGANKRYGKYLDGMKLGQEQHHYDLDKLRQKEPDATLFPDDPKSSVFARALTEHKTMTMNEVAQRQYNTLNAKETLHELKTPEWLAKKAISKEKDHPKMDKPKGNNKSIDLDR